MSTLPTTTTHPDPLADQPGDWDWPEEGPPPSSRPCDDDSDEYLDDDGQPSDLQEHEDFAQDNDPFAWGLDD